MAVWNEEVDKIALPTKGLCTRHVRAGTHLQAVPAIKVDHEAERIECARPEGLVDEWGEAVHVRLVAMPGEVAVDAHPRAHADEVELGKGWRASA
jgi:hypothetical protein